MKLNLGCGDELKEGFLNIGLEDRSDENFLQWDLRKGLPPRIGSISYVMSVHFFEHLRDFSGQVLMKEILSRMADGATFRMALPNFQSLVTAYLENDFSFFPSEWYSQFATVPGTAQLIDIVSYGIYQWEAEDRPEHKSLWDSAKALKVLTYVGFREVHEVPYDRSIEPNSELREKYTFVVEGIK